MWVADVLKCVPNRDKQFPTASSVVSDSETAPSPRRGVKGAAPASSCCVYATSTPVLFASLAVMSSTFVLELNNRNDSTGIACVKLSSHSEVLVLRQPS